MTTYALLQKSRAKVWITRRAPDHYDVRVCEDPFVDIKQTSHDAALAYAKAQSDGVIIFQNYHPSKEGLKI